LYFVFCQRGGGIEPITTFGWRSLPTFAELVKLEDSRVLVIWGRGSTPTSIKKFFHTPKKLKKI
jgi:hypothetical protein